MNATDDPEEILAHDLAFHREIASAAGNATMAAILDGLSSRTFRARVRRGHQEQDAIARTRREHAAIHRALAARDPEAARAAAAAHVGGVEEWLRGRVGVSARPAPVSGGARRPAGQGRLNLSVTSSNGRRCTVIRSSSRAGGSVSGSGRSSRSVTVTSV